MRGVKTSATYAPNRKGDSGEPCGTPLLTWYTLDTLRLKRNRNERQVVHPPGFDQVISRLSSLRNQNHLCLVPVRNAVSKAMIQQPAHCVGVSPLPEP